MVPPDEPVVAFEHGGFDEVALRARRVGEAPLAPSAQVGLATVCRGPPDVVGVGAFEQRRLAP